MLKNVSNRGIKNAFAVNTIRTKARKSKEEKKKLVVRAAATKQLSEGRKRLGTKHKIAGRRRAAGPNLPTTHKAEYLAQHSNVRSTRRVAGAARHQRQKQSFFLYSTKSARTITQS